MLETKKSKLNPNIINEILEIDEYFKVPDKLMSLMFDKKKREKIFYEFLKYETDLSYDWFTKYFEAEFADRKDKKQDFTPVQVSRVLSKLVDNSPGMTMDGPAGTGGIVIAKWHLDQMATSPLTYQPSDYFYRCDELSDGAIPFLLFNLAIRGMNAIVIHGDMLEATSKGIFYLQNENNDFLGFSSINVMPYSDEVAKTFEITWLDEKVRYKNYKETTNPWLPKI
ncbi:hypothetical protein LABALGNA3A7_09590 [Dellaglioa algida]|nr:hypothetical protein LABALGNA3A7_09590 [Dellaglioa algida]